MTLPRSVPWIASLALAALILAFGAAGCGGNPAPPEAPTSATVAATAALPAAGPLSPAVVEILGQVAALRGLSAPATLTAAVIRRAELPALIDATLTAEDRAWFARTTRLYRLLGYIGPADDYLALYLGFAGTAVAALYDQAASRFWLVSETPGALDAPDGQQRSLIAHELVHALQDAAFGLAATTRTVQNNLDRNLAFSALVEGDAVSTERRFTLRPGGAGAVLFMAGSASLQGVPPALEREFRFPYGAGAEWVAGLRRDGGNAAVDALFRSPPSATALILHPGLSSSWAPETVSLPPLEDALGRNWRRDSTGTIGEFHLGNFLQQQLKGLEAIQAAEGWAGDQYDLYTDGKQTVAVFRAHFRDETEAVQFAEAYEAWLAAAGAKAFPSASAFAMQRLANGTTHGLTQASGASVTWVIGSDRASAERAASALING